MSDYRKIIAAAGCVFATGCAGKVQNTEFPPVHRVVTAANAEGGVAVLAQGEAENAVYLNGSRITRLWESGELPVSLEVVEDAGASAGNAYREGFVGSSFYVADIPVGSDLDDIPMHAQNSLDYIVVLAGEIELVLPEKTVKLETGDTLVQAGNMHSWINSGDKPARLMVVVLTGER